LASFNFSPISVSPFSYLIKSTVHRLNAAPRNFDVRYISVRPEKCRVAVRLDEVISALSTPYRASVDQRRMDFRPVLLYAEAQEMQMRTAIYRCAQITPTDVSTALV
jgi:hypothetical protein